jgi:hydroxyacylglutathione hydrolase
MIIRIKNNIFSSNTYLIYDEIKKKCLIIDPGLDEIAIENKINEFNLKPIAIVCTHGHFDHIGGVSFFKDKYGIPFYLHEADIKIMKSANFYLKLTKIDRFIKVPEPDLLINKNSFELKIDNFVLTIFRFSGHTPGSCIVQYKNNIFTGDTIFKEGLYINKLPGENPIELKKNILEIFEKFNPTMICFPGHGKDATLDDIKSKNKDLIFFLNK